MEHVKERTLVATRRSHSTEETISYAGEFAKSLHAGDIVVLVGTIGAGKTYFAKGLASGLGVPEISEVNSPTFDLVHTFQGRLPVFHIDLYRLDHLSNEDLDWLDEYLQGHGVCIVEWGEKLEPYLRDDYLRIELSFLEAENDREISIYKVTERKE